MDVTDKIKIVLQEFTEMGPEGKRLDIPSVSLTSQMTIEYDDDMIDLNQERRRSKSISSPARIPSPKLHRKSSGHHQSGNKDGGSHYHENHHTKVHHRNHNHHHHSNGHHKEHKNAHRSLTSPGRKHATHERQFLSVNDDDDRMFRRLRSNSDSDMSSSKRKKNVLSLNDQYTLRRSRSNTGISDASANENNDFLNQIKGYTMATLSRLDLNGSIGMVGDKDLTLTKRNIECLTQTENNHHKKKTLDLIDSLYEQCGSNYGDVETKINFTFCRLASALDFRRRELLEEARNICEKRKENLVKSKEKCLQCRKCDDVCSTMKNGINAVDSDSSAGSMDNQDELLQDNGILEPWKTTDEHSQNNENGLLSGDVTRNEKSGDVFSELLEEGNLTFIFNEEVIEYLNTIGSIKGNLSSPQLSTAKGLYKGVALTGETVHFEIHTRNNIGEATFNRLDKLEIDVYDSDNEKLDVAIQNLHGKKGNLCSQSVSPSSSFSSSFGHRFYSPYFTPTKPGNYRIVIKLNNVEISSSPIFYTVYPKMDLSFDIQTPEERKEGNVLSEFVKVNTDLTGKELRRTIFRRENSEDSDWQDSNWIVQKGDKSTLLHSVNEIPSYIYADTVVNGLCAWKLRVTSACASITLSIGVGTRTGIPDIDEHFSCDYAIGKVKEQPDVKKTNQKIPLRKSSSFTRISLTYCVLLNTHEGKVRVISEDSDDDKSSYISTNILGKCNLYPFVSMIHHHDSCFMQVCPRPQISLL